MSDFKTRAEKLGHSIEQLRHGVTLIGTYPIHHWGKYVAKSLDIKSFADTDFHGYAVHVLGTSACDKSATKAHPLTINTPTYLNLEKLTVAKGGFIKIEGVGGRIVVDELVFCCDSESPDDADIMLYPPAHGGSRKADFIIQATEAYSGVINVGLARGTGDLHVYYPKGLEAPTFVVNHLDEGPEGEPYAQVTLESALLDV